MAASPVRGFQPVISKGLPSASDLVATWGGGRGMERRGWIENTEVAPLEGMWVWERGRRQGQRWLWGVWGETGPGAASTGNPRSGRKKNL